MAKTQDPSKICNFKQLYNKKYGDIVQLSKRNVFTPEQVFDLAVRYFNWAEENAIQAGETCSFQGRTYEDVVHKPRVFTIKGLSLFCGVTEAALSKWRREPGFCDVMEFIDGVIHEQKFQLAANNMINAGLIGKELGIDKQPSVHVEATAQAANIDNVSAQEVADAVRGILEEI